MKNWENVCQGRYELWTENKEYGEIAVLYENEVYYKEIYKQGNPKYSYSLLVSGKSKHGEIDVMNLKDAQKQVEQIVLKIYKDMIDIKRKAIFEYKKILNSLS